MAPDKQKPGSLAKAPAGAPLIDRVSIAALQKLQERFTALGKVTVCICDVAGNLLTRPSWGSRYSELIGTSARGNGEFLEKVRICALGVDSKVTEYCHEGMTLRATAIRHMERRLAVIVVGTRSAVAPPPRTVRAIAKTYEVNADDLLADVESIDPYSGGAPRAIYRFADVLAETIATLYGQAERIERQLADLSAVHGLAQLLSSTRDLQEILDLTVKRVVEVMNVKACAIRLLDEKSGELVIKAVHNLSDEYLQKGPVMLNENAIDAETFAGNAVYIKDMSSDPRTRYPQNARREGIVSGLCVPMTYRGETLGVLRVYSAEQYSFSRSEESLLRSIGSQAASALVNGKLHEERVRADRVKRQVEAAGEIQRRMLPGKAPDHEHLSFGCAYVPTLQLGGDFYDFIALPGGALGVCIADVVGKGLPAALTMASVRAALRAGANEAGTPERTVAGVSGHMYRDTLAGEFATLFHGVFSADGRTLTYCNAGHPPPILLRGEEIIEMTTGGLVIGVTPDADYEHEALSLRPGDIIVMTTDGVTEAMDFDGTEYGRERLLASIERHRSLEAEQLAGQILWDVRRFAGLAHQSDDITIVVVKVS